MKEKGNKKQRQKGTKDTQALVKVWELNDFFMSLTMTTSFANVARTTASASKFIY